MKLIDSDALDEALLVDDLLVLEERALAALEEAAVREQRTPSRCLRRGVSPSSGSTPPRAPPARGCRSSRAFQIERDASAGLSTRWISRSASSALNQWNAWPTVTAST